MPQPEPDVAFGIHPDLGVVAAVADDSAYLLVHPAIRTCGKASQVAAGR
ncbi:hypothetical protein ACLQ2N_02320 [Streptomyces sp. DT224]|nr:hypothetical protein [Streptomyces sp. NBC_00385]WRZ03615.1 hypothetical protein OG959_09780 [Streptomyces sp. NBC_00385]